MEMKNKNDCDRSNFSLSQAIPYQIRIAGRPSEHWSDWMDQVEIQIDTDPAGFATTTLTGTFDQAGLIGLLRQLYSMGYPLISVNSIQMQDNQ
jgi:hypothetical protein